MELEGLRGRCWLYGARVAILASTPAGEGERARGPAAAGDARTSACPLWKAGDPPSRRWLSERLGKTVWWNRHARSFPLTDELFQKVEGAGGAASPPRASAHLSAPSPVPARACGSAEKAARSWRPVPPTPASPGQGAPRSARRLTPRDSRRRGHVGPPLALTCRRSHQRCCKRCNPTEQHVRDPSTTSSASAPPGAGLYPLAAPARPAASQSWLCPQPGRGAKSPEEGAARPANPPARRSSRDPSGARPALWPGAPAHTWESLGTARASAGSPPACTRVLPRRPCRPSRPRLGTVWCGQLRELHLT